MKKMIKRVMMVNLFQLFALAETNALIEVNLFKTWVIKDESAFGNLAIKNTGTAAILLARDAFDFMNGQLDTWPASRIAERIPDAMYDWNYREITFDGGGFFELAPEETHVYDGRKFNIGGGFSGEKFVVSIYLGKNVWLDSEPLAVTEVVPDSEEKLAAINDGVNLHFLCDLVAVSYKNERWLYKKVLPDSKLKSGVRYYTVCPLSLSNKIRVESHGNGIYKIWDGDTFMIYDIRKSMLVEGPDENDVLGKWTRERKRKAESDNAEVRRKKAEGKK
ncbi:MAG: hypothetical protein FWH21_09235 [Kiritimatiellaeota bacterium]|nr:hypothetical protein [Kiritimatiellota bacterium]